MLDENKTTAQESEVKRHAAVSGEETAADGKKRPVKKRTEEGGSRPEERHPKEEESRPEERHPKEEGSRPEKRHPKEEGSRPEERHSKEDRKHARVSRGHGEKAEDKLPAPAEELPRKKKKKKKWLIAAAVIVVLLVVNIAVKLLKPQQLPMVAGMYAQRGDVEQTLDTSGYVSSEVSRTVFSPVTAYIAESHVEEGQLVSAGDDLVVFELDTLEKAAQQAKLSKDASAYGYQDTLGRANKNDQDLANANTSIGILEQQIDDQENYIANIQEDIRSRQAEAAKQAQEQAAPIEARNIEIENRIAQLNQEIEQLKAAGSGQAADPEEGGTPDQGAGEAPNAALAEKEAELNSLWAEKTENEKKLAALGASAGVDTSHKEAELADAQQQLAEWQADLAQYEGQKSAAEAGQMSGSARAQIATNQKLDTLNASTAAESLERAKAGIQAEMNGVVTEIQIVDGAPVSEGGALFKISSMDDVKVDISVTKYNLENISVGQKADITVAGQDYEGTVTKINRIATKNESGTPVVGAQIHIDNPDENLFLGVEARVSVHMEKAEGVVLAPAEAVNTGVEGSFCWVMNAEGAVEKRMVETGVASSEYVEIISGIEEGEFVISDSSAGAMEGMKVKPLDGSAQ